MPNSKPNTTENLRIPKFILYSAKISSVLSSRLTTRLAALLFVTPIKHKTPKREFEMYRKSKKEFLPLPTLNKKIMCYQYGEASKKILLVHGWSGRGTQLCKIAEHFVNNGYSTVSFDAPAHGKSSGRTTIMTDFITAIHEVDKKYGPFEMAIGHSLGGMSVLSALKNGLQVKSAVIIGSGDVVKDIINDFVYKLQLNPKYGDYIKDYFENKYGEKMDDYSSYNSISTLKLPILIIHDYDDLDVPVSAGIHIHEHALSSTLLLTKKLGHRKILGDKVVIDKIYEFFKKHE